MYHQLKNTILLPDIYIFLKIRKKNPIYGAKKYPQCGNHSFKTRPDPVIGSRVRWIDPGQPKKNLYKTSNWLQIYNETLT
jgi:hypothetical protein